MATITLRVGEFWSVGTTITAYPASNWNASALPPSGAPVGSSADSDTVSSAGLVTFDGVTEGQDYYAYASSRYVHFKVDGELGTTNDPAVVSGTVGISGTVSVDSELPAAAALSDTTANPTAPMVGAAGMVWNSAASQWERAAQATSSATPTKAPAVVPHVFSSGTLKPAQSISSISDGDSGAYVPAGSSVLYNGSTFERQRGNTQGTLLASAARTATTVSSAQTNYNARAGVFFLNITSAGTGNLTFRVRYVDPISGNSVTMLLGAAVTAAQEHAYVVGLGAGTGAAAGSSSHPLPRIFDVSVTPSDASSWTYSVAYALVV